MAGEDIGKGVPRFPAGWGLCGEGQGTPTLPLRKPPLPPTALHRPQGVSKLEELLLEASQEGPRDTL